MALDVVPFWVRFTYFVLLSWTLCGKLSTTTNEKSPRFLGGLEYATSAKVLVTRIAELRIYTPDPAAPLRIWLIHTLIVSKRAWKSSVKRRITEFSGRSGVLSRTAFCFWRNKKVSRSWLVCRSVVGATVKFYQRLAIPYQFHTDALECGFLAKSAISRVRRSLTFFR